MERRVLGSTGIRVSAVAFGAGPVPAVMTSGDREGQIAVVHRAIERGVNWFDTAAGYGQGKSEEALGRAFAAMGAGGSAAFASGGLHVATKVRLADADLSDVAGAVRRSVESSLRRLGLPRVTLFQLHNSITAERGDEPTSLSPVYVLRRKGVLDAFEALRSERLVKHLGLTGIGHPDALRKVIRTGRVETIQIPYNLLNPSAGQVMPATFTETNYGNVIADCAEVNMGVFAIRVLAGGALAERPPSTHTLTTPFFPLPLYERDRAGAARVRERLAERMTVAEAAVRFALCHPAVSSAIVGFSDVAQVDDAVAWVARGRLPSGLLPEIS